MLRLLSGLLCSLTPLLSIYPECYHEQGADRGRLEQFYWVLIAYDSAVNTNLRNITLVGNVLMMIEQFDFQDTPFSQLPTVLYEREYLSMPELRNLKKSPGGGIQMLSAAEYKHAVAIVKNRSNTKDRWVSIPETKDSWTSVLGAPDVAPLKISMTELILGDRISHGAFGRVWYEGSFKGEKVAVKRLAPHRREDLKQFLSFVDEAKLMASMRHARIIKFVGIAWTSPFDLHVVTEYMDGGDLRGLLERYREQRRPTGFSKDKLKIALHVLEGLAYLHALRPRVLHRELNSRNVLLTAALEAKLIDFGVEREGADHTMTAVNDTVRWMAPEVITAGHYGEAADMFSFGVILSEQDTHELPYSVDGQPMRIEAMITEVAMGTLRVAFSDTADAEVVALASECMAPSPADRPSAAAVAERMWQLCRK
ncbi:hypothetical protein P43SY_008426 [Pythium insidiosum]|uniref:Protein kinase domain-containing protein n=1 Tax=Pythium insidiosum TaxID=114742 RepID=A0AAD5Q4Q6_PYTIN|nr:hypothetical protein P43SY_008426 [Pythium insidiosum]